MATFGFSVLLKLNFSGYSITQYTYSGLDKSSTLKNPQFLPILLVACLPVFTTAIDLKKRNFHLVRQND